MDELSPDELVEIMKFAAETGKEGWLRDGWRAVAAWTWRLDDAFRLAELHGSLRLFSEEYGQDRAFRRSFEEVERKLIGLGWPRWQLRRTGPSMYEVDGSRMGYGRLGVLEGLSAGAAVDLLSREEARGGGFGKTVSRRQLERWISGLGGALRERVLATAVLARAIGDLQVFDRHFAVASNGIQRRRGRWRILFRRPAAAVTLDVMGLSGREIRGLRWILEARHEWALVARLDQDLGVRPGADRGSREGGVWGRLWSWMRG